MFDECKSLIIFSNFEINNNERRDKLDEKEKYLDSEDRNKDNNFYLDIIDESIINEDIIYSLEENIKYFLSEYNKVNNTKRNYYARLKNMSDMFSDCSSLISLPNVSNWNTNNVN